MSNQQFEGCIKKSRLPYYDIVSGNIKFKARPVLLIKAEKNEGSCDFTVLPLSSISVKMNINSEYDIPIDKNVYPLLNLARDTSYIRTHKLMTLHTSQLSNQTIANLKELYPDLWGNIVSKIQEYLSGLK